MIKLNFKTGRFSLVASTLLLGSSAVNAQQAQSKDFKGVVGKTLTDSKEVWPENRKHQPEHPMCFGC